MPRGLAHDHDDKRAAIRKGAARYFAAEGYDRASMAGAARACGISKALIYHYYAGKEALLFDILDSHLSRLAEVIEMARGRPGAPEARLRGLIGTILAAYRDADAEHKLQADALHRLAPEARAPLVATQRRMVTRMAGVIAEVAPALDGTVRLVPVTMSVFGMLNWFYMWHRPGRGLDRADYGDLVTDLVLGGIRGM